LGWFYAPGDTAARLWARRAYGRAGLGSGNKIRSFSEKHGPQSQDVVLRLVITNLAVSTGRFANRFWRLAHPFGAACCACFLREIIISLVEPERGVLIHTIPTNQQKGPTPCGVSPFC